eukprot:gene13066-biopygen9534
MPCFVDFPTWAGASADSLQLQTVCRPGDGCRQTSISPSVSKAEDFEFAGPTSFPQTGPRFSNGKGPNASLVPRVGLLGVNTAPTDEGGKPIMHGNPSIPRPLVPVCQHGV